MVSFAVFWKSTAWLVHRNQRLGLRRLSLRSDLLEQRCKGLGIEFRHVMQADFVLFLRDRLDRMEMFGWWPETLLYAEQSGPFEVFARSRSTKYFARAKVLLGIDAKDTLQSLVEAFQKGERIPHWQYESFSPAHLLGLDQIATKP